MNSEVKTLVQRYFDRLSLHSSSNASELEVTSEKRFFEFLSYQEISYIASFLDHEDVQRFRRLSRCHNNGACIAILQNLKDFNQVIAQD